MPYTDDKRIRDLQTQVSPLLNDFIAMDRTGALEATKLTLQQLANLISLNVTKQLAYADIVAPDNALGVNGDFFFRVPADGSLIQMYQKIGSSWASVFSLPLSYKITATEINLGSDGGGGFYLPISVPDGFTVPPNAIVVKGGIRSFVPIQISPDGTALTGFTDNDTQTITIKLI